MSAPQLSFLIPALNEAGAVGAVVRAARAQAAALGVSCEALVLDGGSTDATVAEAAAAGARVVVDKEGFAPALRRGIAEAAGEYIVVMDGDGSHPAERVGALWEKRAAADVVIGSRLVDSGGMELPFYRRVLTRLLNGFFRNFLGVPAADSSSGFRLYRAAAVKGLVGRAKGFEFQQEILLQVLARGGRVAEVPIRYTWRETGTSKARILPLALGYLRTTLRFWFAR